MIRHDINQSDIDAVQEYIDETAPNYHGMTYAQGLQAMLDWVAHDAPRPDKEG